MPHTVSKPSDFRVLNAHLTTYPSFVKLRHKILISARWHLSSNWMNSVTIYTLLTSLKEHSMASHLVSSPNKQIKTKKNKTAINKTKRKTKKLNFLTIIVKYKYIHICIYICIQRKFGKGQLTKSISDQHGNREWLLWVTFLSELKWIFLTELLTWSKQAKE